MGSTKKASVQQSQQTLKQTTSHSKLDHIIALLEDILSEQIATRTLLERKKAKPKTQEAADLNRTTWTAYKKAYQQRYQGSSPIEDAQSRSQMAAFVKRVGKQAPEIAQFYVSHCDSFYSRAGHPIGMMTKDAQKLKTEMETGTAMTLDLARIHEKRHTNKQTFEKILGRIADNKADY